MKLFLLISTLIALSGCQTMGQFMSDVGHGMANNPEPTYKFDNNKSTSCTTSFVGNQAYTNCN